MNISFQSSVIFVNDIDRSRAFYEHLLGQKVLMDFGPSIAYEGGFALWEAGHAYPIIFDGQPDDHDGPKRARWGLCFESDDLDAVWAAIEQAQVPLVHTLCEQPWAQRVFRVYDPDGTIVEFGEPMTVVILRLLAEGLSVEAVTRRTAMPLELVQRLADQAN